MIKVRKKNKIGKNSSFWAKLFPKHSNKINHKNRYHQLNKLTVLIVQCKMIKNIYNQMISFKEFLEKSF